MFKSKFFIFTLSALAFFSISKNVLAFDYEECMVKARIVGQSEMAKCKHSQMLIETEELKKAYNEIAKDSRFNDIITAQNLKRMYNAWLIYRDSYCNAYADTVEKSNKLEQQANPGVTSDYLPEYYLEHCLQEFTKNSKEYIRVMYRAMDVEAHTGS
ncbi:MAG: hypothetical protein PHE89_07430 [Alphaproteobacteria bacterium]|nr:hypothetical protein [Alphaproteobacteria bacterium]